MTKLAVLVVVLLAATACGARPAGDASGASAASSTASPSGPSASASVPASLPGHACPDHVIEGQGTQADLDGDGTADDVTFTQAAGSGCPGGLTARIHAQPVKAATGSLQPGAMRAVTVPGRTGQLLVVRETHPRGGFQDHLFAYADGRLAELTVDGHPLLPFVATDTADPSGGFTVRCTDGGIEVLRAVAHQPIGIAAAFDIVAATYAIDGTSLRSTGTREVQDNVMDKQLPTAYPELAKHTVLTEGCG